MEMILTATMITAAEAKEYGLVNHVVPQAELIEFCQGLAQKISKNAPVALSEAIQAVNASIDKTKNGYEAEINAFGRLFGTADFKEGTTAFLEKRKANFSGK
jgi:enoyl-CoA hydratase